MHPALIAPRLRRLFASALLLACAEEPAAAQATLERWSFEPPGFGRRTLLVSDHAFLHDGGLWHLFYTHRWTPEEPFQSIGHAVSPDMRHWSERPAVVVAESAAPAWRREAVWAPHVVPWPGGGWVMAITGVDPDLSQRIGFLWSEDLASWQESAAAAPFTPDPFLYHYLVGDDNDCRDPHLHFDGSDWHLFFTARGTDGRAVVGHATSTDLESWSHRPPLVSVGDPWDLPDAESPGLVADGDGYLLAYSRAGVYALRSDGLEGPWEADQAVRLDPFGFAGELVPVDGGLILSRARFSVCDPSVTVLWCDSLVTDPWPPRLVAPDRLAEFGTPTGDAFRNQPTYGDPPATRGEPPTGFEGLCWLSSREASPEPLPIGSCGIDRGPGARGEIRSRPFVLAGDSVTVRLGGAVSPDSLHVSLHDACTGERLARLVPAGEALTPRSAGVAAALGRRAEWRIVDDLSRPGGWIGLDELQVRASPGLPPAGAMPVVAWEFPAGGEVFAGGERLRLRWDASHPSGLDSLVLYTTYDGGETLRRVETLSGGRKHAWWTVPDTLLFEARLRLVAYAAAGPSDCASSAPFHVNAVTGAGAGTAGGALSALHGPSGPHLAGSLPVSGPAEGRLEIFDVRGRRVAVAWRGRSGERFRVPAPARDAFGRRLATGLYFARLVHGDRRWETRYLWLRDHPR